MNIFKRLIGSIIDKVLILFIFGIFILIFAPYTGASTAGIFIGAVLNSSTASYPWTEAAANNAYSLSEIDHTIVYSFLILNVLYYFLYEVSIKASLGKWLVGGRCVDPFDDRIDFHLAAIRAFTLGLFIFIAIQIRAFLTVISYTTIIIIFFLVLDLPVLFCKRSLLDIVTGTYYKSIESLSQNTVSEQEKETTGSEKESVSESIEKQSKENGSTKHHEEEGKALTNIPEKYALQERPKKMRMYLIIPLLLCLFIASSYVIYNYMPLQSQLAFKKYNIARFDNFTKERLSINKESSYLSNAYETGTDAVENLQTFGPIPNEKPISTFEGEGDSTYAYKVYWKSYYYEPVLYTVKTTDQWGFVSYEDRIKREKVEYWDYGWRTAPYHYTYSLTTFDMSDEVRNIYYIWKYKELADQFKNSLKGYEDYDSCWSFPLSKHSTKINWQKYHLAEPDECTATSYYTRYSYGAGADSTINILRCVFFANQRAYMLDVRSSHHTVDIANKILNSFTTQYMPYYNIKTDYFKYGVWGVGIITVMFFLILVVFFYNRRKMLINGQATMNIRKFDLYMLATYIVLAIFIGANIYMAYMPYAPTGYHKSLAIYCTMVPVILTLSLTISICLLDNIKKSNGVKVKYLIAFIFLMVAVNTIIFYVDVYSIFNKSIRFDEEWWRYFRPIFYTAIANYILLPCAIILAPKDSCQEYLMPKWLDNYLHRRGVSGKEKKYLLSFLIYPLFTICMVPFGAYALLFVLPTLTIFVILVEVRVFVKWLEKRSNKGTGLADSNNSKAVFKDYYLILDIKSDASDESIDRAFNKAMARYNANADSNMYGKRYVNNLREAYRVLSSKERLKPEYDAEYKHYQESDSQIYEYTNANTGKDIKIIQNEIQRSSITINSVISAFSRMNIVIAAIVIYLVILLALGLQNKDDQKYHYTNGTYNKWDYDSFNQGIPHDDFTPHDDFIPPHDF